MSSEAVKKRGRPKKVISDPVEIKMSEGTKKATTRAKSTKAAPKVVKPAPPTSAKPPVAEKPITKTTTSSTPQVKAAPKPPASPATAPQKPTPTPPKSTVKVSIAPESSKILKELQKQVHSAKTVPPQADPPKYSKPASTTAASKTSYPTQQAKAAPSPTATFSNPSKPATKPVPTPHKPASAAAKAAPPPSAKAAPKLHIPLAALNSEIVSNISTRAGARPNVGSGNPLPKNYKPVARKITMAIVAMPIAIVTSYVLYQRRKLSTNSYEIWS